MKMKYIIGLVVAAAAGVAAGMLLAPEKGKDLRKKIADNGTKFSEKVKEGWKNGKAKFDMKEKEVMEM